MGAWRDTGHWLRSGLDPVECLKKLEGRVITLHSRPGPDEPKAQAGAPATGKKKQSESKAMHDVPWGTGVGNVKAQMAELKRQGFHGAFRRGNMNTTGTTPCPKSPSAWNSSMPPALILPIPHSMNLAGALLFPFRSNRRKSPYSGASVSIPIPNCCAYPPASRNTSSRTLASSPATGSACGSRTVRNSSLAVWHPARRGR